MRKSRSVFVTLLLSFLTVFMIPVVLGGIGYIRIERIMIDNAYRSHAAMLEQIKHVVNGKTQEADNLMQQIVFHPKQQLLMQQAGSEPTSKEHYRYIELMNELNRYKAYSTLIYDIVLYFGHSDTVLTSSLKADADLFFRDIYRFRDMSVDEHKRWLLEGHYKMYERSDVIVSSLKDERMVTFVQSLPFGHTRRPEGSLVLLIQERQFRELFQEFEELHQGTIFILNRDRSLLIGPDEGESWIDAIAGRLTDGSGKFLQTVEGREVLVSYTTSIVNGWTFLSVIPKDDVLMQVNGIKRWSLAAVSVCLLLGAGLCIHLTRRHYSPIRKLVELIVQGRAGVETDSRNELHLIGETMQSLFGKEIELESRLSRQLPIIRSDFLMRLMRGQIDADSVTEDDLSLMGIRFGSDRFAVAIVETDDSGFMMQDHEREWELMRFVMVNVSSELAAGRCCVLELDKKRIAVLLNPADEPDGAAWVRSFSERLTSVMNNKFDTTVTIGVSEVHEGLDKIAECYDEAMLALSYKITHGSSILMYEEIRHLDSDSYRYPLDLELQLINYTRNGDYNNLVRLLDSIYEINFVRNRLSPGMVRWLFLELHSSLFKCLESMRINYYSLFGEGDDPTKMMTTAATAEGIYERIKAMYVKVCELAQAERTEHHDNLLQSIRRFIDEHYHDNNLGLAMIADHLGLNPIYISSFFKKYSGENMTDYITRVRVEHAKKLLAQPYTVQEIAERVGYANNIVLTRVFKKLEGITPGKYRERLRDLKMD
jgi:AraC-like DNA-binding protein